MVAAIDHALELARKVGEESHGVNGMSSWWRSTIQNLQQQRDALEKKVEDVHGTLTVRKSVGADIQAGSDTEHAKKVIAAKKQSEEAA